MIRPRYFFKVLVVSLSLAVLNSAIASIQITDSHGKLSFDSPPQRVVVINWALSEQILELGIVPVGIAGIDAYRKQGFQPIIPNDVVDVGPRAAPDLAKIKALNPDIIVVGYSQRPLVRTLSNIARIVYFNNFSRRYNNEEKSQERFLELARLFGKTDYAQQRLLEREVEIDKLKGALLKHSPQGLPKVAIMLPEKNHAWVFAQNSMPDYALSKLGLRSAFSYPPSKFGVHKVAIKSLSFEADTCVLYISNPSLDTAAIAAGLDALRAKYSCIKRLQPVNAYGGAISVQYLTEAIAKVLLSK